MTYHSEHIGCIRAAEQAQQAEQLTRDWPKIDAAMRDYVESYEMIGDNNEVCYSPTKAEQELIIDCMRGLLAESDFIDMLTAQPTAQQQIVATQLVCDALVAIVAHSGDPAGTVAALAEWRKKAEAFTRNPAAQPPAVAVPLALPDWMECDAKVQAGIANALERFVYANEPAGDSAAEFRRIDAELRAPKAAKAMQKAETERADANERDAERYRWLRSANPFKIEDPELRESIGSLPANPGDVDDAIDQAMSNM